MATDTIVGYTNSNPYGTLTTRSLAYHIHYPHLVGVCNREALALAAIAILLDQLCHNGNSLAGSFGTLQGNVHQTAIIEHTSGSITEFLTTAIGGLMNGKLMLVHQANNGIGFLCLGNLSQIVIALVMIKGTHLTFLVLSTRKEIHIAVCSIVITTIRDNDTAVLAGFLAYDKVGASFGFAN